jgi:hypothetical protein
LLRTGSFEVLEAQLIRLARESDWMMAALRAVRDLGLASWCIGAGAVRNLVWDSLHARVVPSALPDIDVVFFDPTELGRHLDDSLRRRLCAAMPNTPWEVTNQAGVHLWYAQHFGPSDGDAADTGAAVAAFTSLEEAVGSWPEYATTVGLTLDADDTIKVIAPHGLNDLFSLVVRRNPARVSLQAYRDRVAQKRFTERWPRVTVVS